MQKEDIKAIVDKLWKKKSEANWEALESALSDGGIKYYKVFYEKGNLKNAQNLRSSYAELYDSKEKPVAKIPIVIENGKKVEGALIYLKSLSGIRKQ